MTDKKKNDVLDPSFDPSKLDDLIYCVKDEKTNVLFQNDACIQKCSDLKGQPCAKGCMQFYSKLTPTNKDRKGFHFFERRNIDGQNYDIAILRKQNLIISYLHKSLDVGESSKKLLDTPGLTKREKEILSMRLELGLTLKEICEKLFISRATLKTHMNNLNKKLVAAKNLK